MNSYEIRTNSHEFGTNFVRISREFTSIHTNFTLVHPLICPNTRGTSPPNSPAGTLATGNMCTCVWVCLRVGCVGLCGISRMVVWLGLHVGGCVISCLFPRAGVRLCVVVCEDVGATRPHTHTNRSQASHQHPHTHTHNHGPMDTHAHTNTYRHAQTNQHTHTHTHIDTPTMIPLHTPTHDTSTMQVCMRMCGWAVCECGWGGRAV